MAKSGLTTADSASYGKKETKKAARTVTVAHALKNSLGQKNERDEEENYLIFWRADTKYFNNVNGQEIKAY